MLHAVELSSFDLKEEYFDQASRLHGIAHTYRVMCLCLRIGEATCMERAGFLALCAAFVHDQARQHDGYCEEHGRWAAERKLPRFAARFKRMEVNEEEMDYIRTAVIFHSLRREIRNNHPGYTVTAILKDADALDRIRLGFDNLDPAFLRLPESETMIQYAEKLYKITMNRKMNSFAQALSKARSIYP